MEVQNITITILQCLSNETAFYIDIVKVMIQVCEHEFVNSYNK